MSNIHEEVIDKINRDGYDEPHIDLEIDEKCLNKIDIINGLPNFLQNIGLGKKVYKKFIKDNNIAYMLMSKTIFTKLKNSIKKKFLISVFKIKKIFSIKFFKK